MNARRMSRRTSVGLLVQVTAVVALVFTTAAPAFAAKPDGGGGGGGSATTGYDLSYPQCGSTFPSSTAFGIVGVNGGLANNLNSCLGPASSYTQSELYWAVATSTGATSQPKASLYVNTADPGNIYNGNPIADWPTTGGNPVYGTCTTTIVTTSTGTYTVGQNSQACAWQYGFNKASQDALWLTNAAQAINAQTPPIPVFTAAGSYLWWLDVETANTWQTGTTGLAMNVADLQGMIAALQGSGVTTVGAYSTSSQWNQIIGVTTSASGSLWTIPDWIPGARTLSGAKSNCTQTSFTGGTVSVTQWFSHPDGDYAC